MVNEIVRQIKPKMEGSLNHLRDQLKNIRTSGAQSSLVEDIKVKYYGTDQPLKTLAQITTPDYNLIVIQPFDRNALDDISLAIRNSNLNLNPSSDGMVLRINIPALTEERRNELIKLIHTRAEETRIALRTTREETWKEVQKLHKDKQLSDDDRSWGKEELDKIIAEFNQSIEKLIKEKEESLKSI